MFKFDEKVQDTLTINVEGKEYSFNPRCVKVENALRNFTMRQETLVKKLKKKELTNVELREIELKSCNLCKDTINMILGKKSYDLIFGERTLDFKEHNDFVTYLFTEITKYSERINAKSTH